MRSIPSLSKLLDRKEEMTCKNHPLLWVVPFHQRVIDPWNCWQITTRKKLLLTMRIGIRLLISWPRQKLSWLLSKESTHRTVLGRKQGKQNYEEMCNISVVVRVWLFATPLTAARQASLSFTISRSLPRLVPIVSVMPSNHLTLRHPFSSCPQSFPASVHSTYCWYIWKFVLLRRAVSHIYQKT